MHAPQKTTNEERSEINYKTQTTLYNNNNNNNIIRIKQDPVCSIYKYRFIIGPRRNLQQFRRTRRREKNKIPERG